jgi:hypothetical protein
LSVCGYGSDYSKNLTDIFDITEAAKAFGYNFKKQPIPNSESSCSSETKSTESSIPDKNCGCDSMWILNNIALKMDHYLEAFALKMFELFNRKFISTISSRYFYDNINIC